MKSKINLKLYDSHPLSTMFIKCHFSQPMSQPSQRHQGSSPITQVALHPRGDLILSCAADRQLRLWEPWDERWVEVLWLKKRGFSMKNRR